MATRPGGHARTPDIVANLFAGVEIFLAFARESGAIDAAEAEQVRHTVWDGLMEAAAEADADNEDEGNPAERYLQLLVSSLNGTKAYLTDAATDDVPDGIEAACGWHLEVKNIGQGMMQPVWVPGPNTPRIGWIDGDRVYLDPDQAYSAAARILREQGESLPSKKYLHIQL